MAVAFVQAVVDTDDSAGNDFLTTINIGSGANRCLALYISHRGSTTGYSATSDVDGALTLIGTVSSQADAFGRAVSVFRLLNPTSGNHTITVSASSGTVHGIYTQIEMTGVDQTTPVASTDSDTGTGGTSSSSTPPTAGDDDLIVDGIALRLTSAPTVGADQTERSNSVISGGINVRGATSTQPGSVSGDVMSWTYAGAQNAQLGVAFAAAATAHALAAAVSGSGSVTADLTHTETHALAASITGSGAVTADLSVQETHALAASIDSVGSVTAALTLVLAPAVAGSVPAPLAIVYVHDAAGRRIGQLTTAHDVARSYELGGVGLASLAIAENDPLVRATTPLIGNVLVIESSSYPYPWVGAIARRTGNRERGTVSLQARGFGSILDERVLPTDYETSLNAGDEIERVLNTVNRRNGTGIVMGSVANHGQLAAGLRFPEAQASRALDQIADAGRVEWWLEFFAGAASYEAVLRVARSRGFDRFRVGPVLRDGFNATFDEWIEDGGSNVFALHVVAGQTSVTESFVERSRHTVVREEGGGFVTELVPIGSSTSNTVGTGGRRTKDSAISHGFARFREVLVEAPTTRREVVVVREELRSQDITVQAADAILDRIPIPERTLRLDAIATADWAQITPGDILRVDAPGAFVEGWDGPVRVLGTQPLEDEGRMPLVVELMEEVD